ncbi:MAG: hypothetical protein H6910_06705 [Rickettsiaceae bacterium]|nr:hypothetical protein [Rickettsiaceae bacterium]
MDSKLQRDLEKGNVLSVRDYIINGKPKTRLFFFKDGYQAAGLFYDKNDQSIFKILCNHPSLAKLLPLFVENIHAICKREEQDVDIQLKLLNNSLNKKTLDFLDHTSVLKLLKQFNVEDKSSEDLFNTVFKYVFTNTLDDAASMVRENIFHQLVRDHDLVKLIYIFVKKIDTLSSSYNLSRSVLLSLLQDKLTHEVNGKAPVDHMPPIILQSLAKLLRLKYTETNGSNCGTAEYKQLLKIIFESSYTVILDDSLLPSVIDIRQETNDANLDNFFDIMVNHYIQTGFTGLPPQWTSDGVTSTNQCIPTEKKIKSNNYSDLTGVNNTNEVALNQGSIDTVVDVHQKNNSIYEVLGEYKSPRREKSVVTPEVVFEEILAKVQNKSKEHNKLQNIFGEKYSLAHTILYYKPSEKFYTSIISSLHKKWTEFQLEGDALEKCVETLTTDQLLTKFTFANANDSTLLKHACLKNSELLVLLYTRMKELQLLNCNTALEVAISCHNKQLVQYIIEQDSSAIDWYSFLRNSIKYANSEAVQFYIDSESPTVEESYDRQGGDSNTQYTIFNYALLSLTELYKSRQDVEKIPLVKIESKILTIFKIVNDLYKNNKLYLATDQVDKLSADKSVLTKTNSLFKNLCRFAQVDEVLKKECQGVGKMLMDSINNKDLQSFINNSLMKMDNDDALSSYNESSVGTHRSVLSDMPCESANQDSVDIAGDLAPTS